MEKLFISDNQLSGSIPSSLSNLMQLNYLHLYNNQLSGSIPSELGSLSNLLELYLHGNQLSGTIPSELANLSNLQYLQLNNNQLSGTIPSELGNLSKLQRLYLDGNQLTSMPDFSGSEMESAITTINVKNNRLDFSSIEPNVGVASTYIYSPQDSLGEAVDTTLKAGSFYSLKVSAGGDSTSYQWFKNGNKISGATDSIYALASVALSDSGVYTCEATNIVATDLTLHRRPVTLHIELTTNVEDRELVLPKKFDLSQNYPNPFNPTTTINYALPQGSNVQITVYNTLGEKIVELVNGNKSAGRHRVTFDAAQFASGVYYYKIKAGSFMQIKKMILLR